MDNFVDAARDRSNATAACSFRSLGLWCELFTQHAAGYGVEVHNGAWAEIDSNLFDMNRHAIAGGGFMGGYDARRNLVLKGAACTDGRGTSTHTSSTFTAPGATAWVATPVFRRGTTRTRFNT